NFDANASGLGVERVFYQLLDHTGRTLHDFPRGDLVGNLLGEQANAVHGSASGSVGSRQGKGKDRAAVWPGAGGNISVVLLNDLLRDGKPQTCPLDFAEGDERFKDVVQHFRGDASASVLDLCCHSAIAQRETQSDLTAFRHRIDGVAEKVVEN